jgi:hypothetical protein
VRRLSSDRVQQLAEEIWTASSGDLPARPALVDPRSSLAGASAQAAYLRRRRQDRERWQLDWAWWSLAVLGAAAAGALMVGTTLGDWLAGPAALLLATWTGWRLRFRLSPAAASWRRQATIQRRTAGLLTPLEDKGYVVLHDITLPGWLEGLEHLVIGPTGVWVVQSCPRRRPTARRHPGAGAEPQGTLRELRWKIEALAKLLDRGARMPVRGLLCARRSWASCHRSVQNVHVATPRKLAWVVRQEPPVAPAEVERATAQLLEVLRPAA